MSASTTTKTSIEVFRSKCLRLCSETTMFYAGKAMAGDKDSYAALTLLDEYENTFRDADSSRESMRLAYANLLAYATAIVKEMGSVEGLEVAKRVYTRESLKRQLKRTKRKLEKMGFEADLTMAEFPTARGLMEAIKESVARMEELVA